MPTITVSVDEGLKERMNEHPEINWSEVTRQAIQDKLTILELMDELVVDSELSERDVAELADEINANARADLQEARD
jgi:hypothetical protein